MELRGFVVGRPDLRPMVVSRYHLDPAHASTQAAAIERRMPSGKHAVQVALKPFAQVHLDSPA
jgi:hypothetical protein